MQQHYVTNSSSSTMISTYEQQQQHHITSINNNSNDDNTNYYSQYFQDVLLRAFSAENAVSLSLSRNPNVISRFLKHQFMGQCDLFLNRMLCGEEKLQDHDGKLEEDSNSSKSKKLPWWVLDFLRNHDGNGGDSTDEGGIFHNNSGQSCAPLFSFTQLYNSSSKQESSPSTTTRNPSPPQSLPQSTTCLQLPNDILDWSHECMQAPLWDMVNWNVFGGLLGRHQGEGDSDLSAHHDATEDSTVEGETNPPNSSGMSYDTSSIPSLPPLQFIEILNSEQDSLQFFNGFLVEGKKIANQSTAPSSMENIYQYLKRRNSGLRGQFSSKAADSHPLKMALFSCPLHLPKMKSKHAMNIQSTQQYKQWIELSEKYFEQLVNSVRRLKLDLIICQWDVDQSLIHQLEALNCRVVQYMNGHQLQQIATASGAQICFRIKDLSEDVHSTSSMFGWIQSIQTLSLNVGGTAASSSNSSRFALLVEFVDWKKARDLCSFHRNQHVEQHQSDPTFLEDEEQAHISMRQDFCDWITDKRQSHLFHHRVSLPKTIMVHSTNPYTTKQLQGILQERTQTIHSLIYRDGQRAICERGVFEMQLRAYFLSQIKNHTAENELLLKQVCNALLDVSHWIAQQSLEEVNIQRINDIVDRWSSFEAPSNENFTPSVARIESPWEKFQIMRRCVENVCSLLKIDEVIEIEDALDVG